MFWPFSYASQAAFAASRRAFRRSSAINSAMLLISYLLPVLLILWCLRDDGGDVGKKVIRLLLLQPVQISLGAHTGRSFGGREAIPGLIEEQQSARLLTTPL